MDNEDIFGTSPIAEEQAFEPMQEAPAEPEPVAEPVAVEPAAPPVATPEPAKPEPGFVPLAAVLDERDRRKQLEAQLAQFQAQQNPPEPIDVYDPEQLAAFQQQQVINTKLDISEDMTRDKFGDELVDKARDWVLSRFTANPAYQQEVLKQRNPWKYVVEQYQRDQIASQVSLDDFQQFQAWKAAQAQITPQPTIAAPIAATPSPVPPPSLASAPSAGPTTQPKPDPVKARLDSMF